MANCLYDLYAFVSDNNAFNFLYECAKLIRNLFARPRAHVCVQLDRNISIHISFL